MFGIESYKNINSQYNLDGEEDEYRQKYLKYKQKYLELKQSGGGLDGEYAYLTTEDKAKELVELFKKCGYPTEDNLNAMFNQESFMVSAENKKSELKTTLQNFYTQCNNPTELEINTILNDAAYRIKKNTKNIELVLNISTAAKVGEKVGKVGSKISKGFKNLIKSKNEPAEPAVTVVKTTKNSAKTQANNVLFSSAEPDVLKKLLFSIKVANQVAYETTATPLTHYVLINHKSSITKNEITLADKENPIKELPTVQSS
jgi:hypothetical protein